MRLFADRGGQTENVLKVYLYSREWKREHAKTIHTYAVYKNRMWENTIRENTTHKTRKSLREEKIMKKRTRIAGIILTAALAAGSLAGCGGAKAETASGTTAGSTTAVETTKESATAESTIAENTAASGTAAESTTVAEAADEALAKIQEAGVLTIGTEGTYAPYSYHDESGKLVGFDVEIAELIAEKLGVKAEFAETKWDAMIAGLDAKRFDIIANQVGITDARKEKYDFSEPYTYIHGALIVQKDNEDIKTFEDLAGKKSAQTLTSNWGQTAEQYGAELVGVDGFEQSIELIASGRADATINSEVALYDYLKQKPDAPIKVVALSDNPSIVGIPVRKGEDSLYEAVNKAILELKEEGKLTELSLKYFGVDITQE